MNRLSAATDREPAPTVLIVDDDHRVREVLEIAFTNQGYRVVTAADGDQALKQAAAHQPDLVVLDIRLPRKSGLEVCEALRQSPADVPVAIILVSAAIEGELRLQGFHRGADDYLSKPFSPRELVARARRLIARSRDLNRARRRVAELEQELRRSWEESRRARDEARRISGQAGTIDQAREDFDRARGVEALGRALLARVRAEAAARSGLLLVRSEESLTPVVAIGIECETRALRLARGGPLEETLAATGRPVTAKFLASVPGALHELVPFETAGFDCFVPVCHEQRLEALLVLSGGSGLCDAESTSRITALGQLAAAAFAAHRARRDRALDLIRLLADGARGRGFGIAHFEAARAAERAALGDGLPSPWPALVSLAVEMQGTFEEPSGKESLARLAVLDPSGVVTQVEALALMSECAEEAHEFEAARRFVALGSRIAELIGAGVDLESATVSAAIETPGVDRPLRNLFGIC